MIQTCDQTNTNTKKELKYQQPLFIEHIIDTSALNAWFYLVCTTILGVECCYCNIRFPAEKTEFKIDHTVKG